MINKNMFFAEDKIKDYRDMKLDDILREHLLFKGTIDSNGMSCNMKVKVKDLVSSGLFVYNLKTNATNKQAIIIVPPEIWKECNDVNKNIKNRSKEE